MNAELVKQHVKQFREKTAHTGREEHSFAPWYLHQQYHLSDTVAMQQASDGNYDFGVDAFVLDGSEESKVRTLVLVQAKYTESLQLIAKGFKDLERTLDEVRRCLDGNEPENPIENKVLMNIRAALNRLPEETRGGLNLELQVLHLSTDDDTILGNRFSAAMTRLSEVVGNVLEGHKCSIRHVGPRDLGPQQVVVVPPETIALRLNGTFDFGAGESGRMVTGVGHLADLVDLYRARRDGLFSRNVRYYLKSKKNTEKGPAGKMRATLKLMCVDGHLAPERFAMFHNGVTLFARRAEAKDGKVNLRDAYVLNGCQTIKNAFFFRHDPNLQSRVKDDLWQRVVVPIRVIETTDDELVRTVTVNNNRQNAMSAAALRSNDKVQISLEQRFKDRRIVYERQEGAFDNIWRTQPELLEDEYENSRGAWADIAELARAIAAAAGEVRLAQHPNDLFESDAAYERCFDEQKHLRSIVFLTFLQNVHDVVGLILKKDLNLAQKNAGPKPARLGYHTICLMVRHLAKEWMRDFVAKWGGQLHYKDAVWREEVRRVLNSQRSGIRLELAREFMSLESNKANDVTAAFERCKKNLRLGDNIDPFEVFGGLDEVVPVSPEAE